MLRRKQTDLWNGNLLGKLILAEAIQGLFMEPERSLPFSEESSSDLREMSPERTLPRFVFNISL
jgi:hypothetical protein